MSLINEIPAELTVSPLESKGFETVRGICLDMPGVIETHTPGQTSFKVGQRAFVVIETYRSPTGVPYNWLAFKASFFDHERLTADPVYCPAPYLGGSGWLGRRLDHPEQPIDWKDIEAILGRSHRQIAGRSGMISGRRMPAAASVEKL